MNQTASRSIALIGRRHGPNLKRHAPDESDEVNPKGLHPLLPIGRFVNVPPLPLLENFPQRLSNGGIVFFPRNFFLKGAIDSDQMIISDPAFLGIKFRERFGVVRGDDSVFECKIVGASTVPVIGVAAKRYDGARRRQAAAREGL